MVYRHQKIEIWPCNKTHRNHGDDLFGVLTVSMVVCVGSLEANFLTFYNPQVSCLIVVSSCGTCTCESYFLYLNMIVPHVHQLRERNWVQ